MRVALVVVSIVAVLAIGALAAVLVTGWSINDEDPVADVTETEVIADAQVTWCWTYRGQLVVSADALDIRNSSAAAAWGGWLSLSVVVTDWWDAALEALFDDWAAARDEFDAWLDDRGHEAVDDVLPFVEIVNEDEEFRRACLAAWGAAFGTTPRDSD